MQPTAAGSAVEAFDLIGPHGDTDHSAAKFLTAATAGGPHGYLSDEEHGEDDDDDADETIGERLIGLTEMLPESLRSAVSSTASFSWKATKSLYGWGRVAVWVVVSSATILALPVMFESERMQMEEQQIQQQRQILLGPNVAMSGHLSPGLPHGPMASFPQVNPK